MRQYRIKMIERGEEGYELRAVPADRALSLAESFKKVAAKNGDAITQRKAGERIVIQATDGVSVVAQLTIEEAR